MRASLSLAVLFVDAARSLSLAVPSAIRSWHPPNAGQMDTTSRSPRPPKATVVPKNPSSLSWGSRWRDSARSSLVTHIVVVVVGAVLLAFLAPRLPHTVHEIFDRSQHWRASSQGITLRNPLVFQQQSVCPKPTQHVEFKGTFNTRPERSMALADQAKRVAAEFDFSQDAVNKAVKEFIREMGMHREECWADGRADGVQMRVCSKTAPS